MNNGLINYALWANEYEEQMQTLNRKIETLKKERKICTAVCTELELNKRINGLYSMYLECKHTAQMMRNRAKEKEAA